MRKIFVCVAALIVVIAVAAVARFALVGTSLSERPPRAGEDGGGLETEADSHAVLQVRLSYATVRAALEKYLPAQIAKDFQTHPAKSFIGPGPGVAGAVLVERGPISLGPGSPDPKTPGKSSQLSASVQGNATGWAGFQGEPAKWVGIDKKNLKGQPTLTAVGSVAVDKEWTPTLALQLSHSWSEGPKIEIMGNVWVDVPGDVDGKINEELAKAAEQLKTSLNKNAIRNAVAPEWRVHHLVLGSYAGNEIVTTLTPLAAGYSSATFDKDGAAITFSLGVRSKTVLAAAASPVADGPPLPLPELNTLTDADPQKTVLQLPLYASYDAIQSSVRKSLPSDELSVPDSPLGKGTVRINDFEIYSTQGNRLAVGVKLDANFARRFFNSRGWVWLTARPRIDERTQKLVFDDVHFTHAFDNALVDILAGLLQTRLETLLNEHSTLDFTRQAHDLKAAIAKALDDPKTFKGLHVSALDLEVTCVNPVVLTKETLGVSAHVEATITCKIQSLPGF